MIVFSNFLKMHENKTKVFVNEVWFILCRKCLNFSRQWIMEKKWVWKWSQKRERRRFSISTNFQQKGRKMSKSLKKGFFGNYVITLPSLAIGGANFHSISFFQWDKLYMNLSKRLASPSSTGNINQLKIFDFLCIVRVCFSPHNLSFHPPWTNRSATFYRSKSEGTPRVNPWAHNPLYMKAVC